MGSNDTILLVLSIMFICKILNEQQKLLYLLEY